MNYAEILLRNDDQFMAKKRYNFEKAMGKEQAGPKVFERLTAGNEMKHEENNLNTNT